MQMNNDNEHRNEEPIAPAPLIAALHRLQKKRVVVPASVDDAILSQARQHLRPSPKARYHGGWIKLCGCIRSLVTISRFHWLKLAPLAAAATALILLVWLVPKSTFRQTVPDIEDVNHDGQVDILDAFALARQLQQGEQPRPQLDLNGDGVIDEQDVLLIADHAVSLDRRRHSS